MQPQQNENWPSKSSQKVSGVIVETKDKIVLTEAGILRHIVIQDLAAKHELK